jgi:hypothetical protein
MEYIHKAKAEKNRTKVLTDQMEARRVKNKVRNQVIILVAADRYILIRLLGHAVQSGWQKSAREFLLWNTRQPCRSKWCRHVHGSLLLGLALSCPLYLLCYAYMHHTLHDIQIMRSSVALGNLGCPKMYLSRLGQLGHPTIHNTASERSPTKGYDCQKRLQ